MQRAESPAERQVVLQWWDLTMSARGVARNARRVLIMQRLHAGDLSAHVLAEGGWEHLCLPMRYEHGRTQTTSLSWEDPRAQEGQLLCPRLLDEAQVRAMEKSMGSYGAAGQLQQRPVPREGGMFQHAWFTQIVAAAPAPIERVRYWDRAATAGGGCYTCGVLLARSNGGGYYVEDVVRGQWSSWQRDQIMLRTAWADRARYGDMQPEIVVEREGGSSGKDSVWATARLFEGFSIRTLLPTGNKEARAEPFAAQCEAGNVYLVHGSWNQEYIDELCLFPMSTYSDQMDASSGAYNYLAQGAHPARTLTGANGPWPDLDDVEAALGAGLRTSPKPLTAGLLQIRGDLRSIRVRGPETLAQLPFGIELVIEDRGDNTLVAATNRKMRPICVLFASYSCPNTLPVTWMLRVPSWALIKEPGSSLSTDGQEAKAPLATGPLPWRSRSGSFAKGFAGAEKVREERLIGCARGQSLLKEGQTARVGLSAQDRLVPGFDQVLLILWRAKDQGGHGSRSGAAGQCLTEAVESEGIGQAAQGVLIERVEEGNVVAPMQLEVFRRAGNTGGDQFDGAAVSQAVYPEVQAARVSLAVQVALVEGLDFVRAVLGRAFDGQDDGSGGGAVVEEIGPGSESAGVRSAVEKHFIDVFDEDLVSAGGGGILRFVGADGRIGSAAAGTVEPAFVGRRCAAGNARPNSAGSRSAPC